MFFKTENSNKISSVFDAKIDQCVKIKKEYEANLESYIYNLCTIADKIEINFKPNDNLQEIPNYLIFQLFLITNKTCLLELVLAERNSNIKKRVQFTTLALQIEEKPNLLISPLKKIKRNIWINLVINLHQIVEIFFNLDPNSIYIEQIFIHSYCKLRKIICSDITFEVNESPKHLNLSKLNESKLFYLNELLSCHSKFVFSNENLFFENSNMVVPVNYETFANLEIKKRSETEKTEKSPKKIFEKLTQKNTKKTLEKSKTLGNIYKKNNKKNVPESKNFDNDNNLPKIRLLKTLKPVFKKKTLKESSNSRKAIILKKIVKKKDQFKEMAKKFNSISINSESRNENVIAESINVISHDNTMERYEDGSLETVKSVEYPRMLLKSKSNENVKDIVEETFENEFFDKSLQKKEVNFENIKFFKNSSLITLKNNEKVILERKDNFENKRFINEIDNFLNKREEEGNFLFDPVLKSFYDPKTQTYYHKI